MTSDTNPSIHIRLLKETIELVDAVAGSRGQSRSSFVREAVRLRLSARPSRHDRSGPCARSAGWPDRARGAVFFRGDPFPPVRRQESPGPAASAPPV